MARALERGRRRFLRARRCAAGSPAEDLFALAAASLRALRPCRGAVGPVLATSLGPLRAGGGGDPAGEARAAHLEAAAALLREHGREDLLDPASLHLYWTLFLGTVAFWAGDRSPGREDTLAVLDRATALFARPVEVERA